MSEALPRMIYGSGSLERTHQEIEKLHTIGRHITETIRLLDQSDEFGYDNLELEYDILENQRRKQIGQVESCLFEASIESLGKNSIAAPDSLSVLIAYTSYLEAAESGLRDQASQLAIAGSSMYPGVPLITDPFVKPQPAVIEDGPAFLMQYTLETEYPNLEYSHLTFRGLIKLARPRQRVVYSFGPAELGSMIIGSCAINCYMRCFSDEAPSGLKNLSDGFESIYRPAEIYADDLVGVIDSTGV